MKNTKRFFLFVFLIGLFFLGLKLVSFSYNRSYKTVDKTTVLSANSIVFVPSGAFLLGEAYEVTEIDDELVPLAKVPENEKIRKKILVKTEEEVVIYFNESE